MDRARRTLLRGIATAGAAAATTGIAGTAPASASAAVPPPDDAVGMLYDTTRCIGCKACMVACKRANGLPADESGPYEAGLYDQPIGLTASTKTVVQAFDDGERRSYVKRQCMHCVDPACASACMFGALHKGERGIVSWDGSKCVGCRYCQIGCPYNVPRFEWNSRNPAIVKCELCRGRLDEGDEPACCEVCPREAIVYGDRDDLLAEARRRIAEHPGRYVPHVYGEHEGGGTQVLYLSHVPFEQLGLPLLDDRSAADQARTVQHSLYKGFVAPVVLYGLLCTFIVRSRKQERAAAERAARGAAGLPAEAEEASS